MASSGRSTMRRRPNNIRDRMLYREMLWLLFVTLVLAAVIVLLSIAAQP